MNKIKKIIAAFLSAFTMIQLNAQVPADAAKSAERMQQSIYIVMAVVVTIVIGLFFYLLNIDRKISKLEKKS